VCVCVCERERERERESINPLLLDAYQMCDFSLEMRTCQKRLFIHRIKHTKRHRGTLNTWNSRSITKENITVIYSCKMNATIVRSGDCKISPTACRTGNETNCECSRKTKLLRKICT
jgi:hypothetical protein